MRLGWRSWLIATALLLWLGMGMLAISSAWATGAPIWLWVATLTTGLLLPLASLAMLKPLPRPPGVPAGMIYTRSRGWLLAYSLGLLMLFSVLLLLTPLLCSAIMTEAQAEWAAGKFVKSLFFGLSVLVLMVAVLLVPCVGYWMLLRPAWQRRRWPFAVLSDADLWIDGHLLAWSVAGPVSLISMRAGNLIEIITLAKPIVIQLMPLAGSAQALIAAIEAHLPHARRSG